MSCYHRYYPHGCDWPPPPEWYERVGSRPPYYRDDVVVVRGDDLEEDEERPRRRHGGNRRNRRYRDEQSESMEEVTVASLQSRAEALRDELLRIEEGLKRLSAEPGSSSET